MKRLMTMDHSQRLSRSMPLLMPSGYVSPISYRAMSPRWPERLHQPRHYYIGGVRTKLLGAGSYPNTHRFPQRLIVCGAGGVSLQKMTRSSSIAELAHSGVYRSTENLSCEQRNPRRAASCDDVSQGRCTPTWDCRFSESGVSLNDSRTDVESDGHTDLGSVAGLEDVDGGSHCSFGSSSAFHETTCDSELDRLDSDTVSLSGSACGLDQTLDVTDDGDACLEDHTQRIYGRTDSKEDIMSDLTSCSGRTLNSPVSNNRESYCSTPTNRGSPLSSVYPSDERDYLHGDGTEIRSWKLTHDILQTDSTIAPNHRPKCAPFDPSKRFSNHSSRTGAPRDSPLASPSNMANVSVSAYPRTTSKTERHRRIGQTVGTGTESMAGCVDRAARRAMCMDTRSQPSLLFSSSRQEDSVCSQQQTAGESVQDWLTTGHAHHPHQHHPAPSLAPPPPSFTSEPRSLNTQQQQPQQHQLVQQQTQLHELANGQSRVQEWVLVLEPGPLIKIPNSDSVDKDKESDKNEEAKTVYTHLCKEHEHESTLSTETESGCCGLQTGLGCVEKFASSTKTSPVTTESEEGGAGCFSTHFNTHTIVARPYHADHHVRGDGDGKQPSSCGAEENAGIISPAFTGCKKCACPCACKEKSNTEHSGDRGLISDGSGIRGVNDLINCRSVNEVLTANSRQEQQAANSTANGVVSGVDFSSCDDDVNIATPNVNYAAPDSTASNIKKFETSETSAAARYSENNTAAYHAVTCGDENSSYRASLFTVSSGRSDTLDAIGLLQREEEDVKKRVEEGLEGEEREDGRSSCAQHSISGTAFSRSTSCSDNYSCDEARSPTTHAANYSLPLPACPALTTPSPDRCVLPSTFAESYQQVALVQRGVNTQPSAALSTHQERLHHMQPKTTQSPEAVGSVDHCIDISPAKNTCEEVESDRASPGRITNREEDLCGCHTHHVCHKDVVTTAHHTTGSPLAEGEASSNNAATKHYCQQKGGEGFFVTATGKGEGLRAREEAVTSGGSNRGWGPFVPGERRGQEQCHPHTDASPTISANNRTVATAPALVGSETHLCSPSQSSFPHGDERKESSSGMMAGSGHQINSPSASFNLLDSLQQQLSLLSSEDVSFTSDTWSPEDSGQVLWYRDHAEASLPRVHNDGEDKTSVVQGTGSVSFTLENSQRQQQTTRVSRSAFSSADRIEASTTEWNTDCVSSHGSVVSETRRESSFRHGRLSQVLSTVGGEVFSSDKGGRGGSRKDGSGDNGLSLSSPQAIRWQPPVSSSECEDSDGNYTSVSTTDSSQHHSESEFVQSDYDREDYDNVDSFGDFVSGLQGQCTSDRPSVHHRMDMVTTDYRSSRLRSCIQETILEADDESETADEADTINTTVTSVSSYRSTFHYSLPQSTPKLQAVCPVPEIKVWSTDQQVADLSASEGRTSSLSPVHPLQDLSDKLSSFSDVSFEFHTLHDSHDDLDVSESRRSACSSPAPSDVSEGSVYSSLATAEVRKQAEQATSVMSAEPSLTQKITCRKSTSTFTASQKVTCRNLTSAFSLEASKKAKWIQDKVLLFQKLLNDLESQCKTPEQTLIEEMYSYETVRNGDDDKSLGNKESDTCAADLYRSFTQETLEKRQNHICPIVEDHLPVFRFKRFLKKKHNSKLKGRKTFRVRHHLAKLTESPVLMESKSEMELDRMDQTLNEAVIPSITHSPCHLSRIPSHTKQREMYMCDDFTDDADVKRSLSDSAYSTLSETTSRHLSDLDSTLRSVGSSRGDVSSIATDLSMDSDKLTSLSDVFDQLDVCEGEIDQALLDRLQVGHYKADTL